MSHALFDALRAKTGTTTDEAVARLLGMSPSHISAYRYGREIISPAMILRIYDLCDLTIEQIRALIADKSPKAPSARELARQKKAAKDDLLSQIAARPKRSQRKSGEDSPRVKRLTVTKSHQWTSTVHRVL